MREEEGGGRKRVRREENLEKEKGEKERKMMYERVKLYNG